MPIQRREGQPLTCRDLVAIQRWLRCQSRPEADALYLVTHRLDGWRCLLDKTCDGCPDVAPVGRIS